MGQGISGWLTPSTRLARSPHAPMGANWRWKSSKAGGPAGIKRLWAPTGKGTRHTIAGQNSAVLTCGSRGMRASPWQAIGGKQFLARTQRPVHRNATKPRCGLWSAIRGSSGGASSDGPYGGLRGVKVHACQQAKRVRRDTRTLGTARYGFQWELARSHLRVAPISCLRRYIFALARHCLRGQVQGAWDIFLQAGRRWPRREVCPGAEVRPGIHTCSLERSPRLDDSGCRRRPHRRGMTPGPNDSAGAMTPGE